MRRDANRLLVTTLWVLLVSAVVGVVVSVVLCTEVACGTWSVVMLMSAVFGAVVFRFILAAFRCVLYVADTDASRAEYDKRRWEYIKPRGGS